MKKTILLFILFALLSPGKVSAAGNYSQHLGFIASGAVNPPQYYISTFENLHVNWASSYGPTIPADMHSYHQLNNITHSGTGDGIINITPWTKPTYFPVYSKTQLGAFVQSNRPGAYYLIGSEANVTNSTDINQWVGRFEYEPFDYHNWWRWFLNSNGSFGIDKSTSFQGDTSFYVEGVSPGQYWLKSNQFSEITPPGTKISGGKKYRVTVAIKTENVVSAPGQGAGLHIYENGVWPGSAKGAGMTVFLNGTNDWQEYSFDFITQPQTTYIEFLLGLGFGANATGKVRFDSLRITDLDQNNNPLSQKAIANYYSGAEFAPIYHYYVSAIKSLDPQAKIVGPNFLTFSSLPPGQSTGAYGLYIPGAVWFDDFLSRYQSLYNSKPYFDIYATHVYDNLRPWNLNNYLSYAKQNVSEFRQYINNHFGTDKEVWITEFGVQTQGVPDSEVSLFLENMHNYFLQRNDIGKWIWAWSLAPPYYPFSGFLFQNNSNGAPLTSVGQKFAQLALADSIVPNCFDLTGPQTVEIGQPALFQADFSSAQGYLRGEIYTDSSGRIINQYFGDTATAGHLVGNWTPTLQGTYHVYCRAWNSNKAECQSSELASGSIYPCDGPKTSLTVNVTNPLLTPTPTSTPIPPTPTSIPTLTPLPSSTPIPPSATPTPPDFPTFLNLFKSYYNKSNPPSSVDLNNNGKVDIFDYNLFMGNMGK